MVWPDGLIRVQRGVTEAQHAEAVKDISGGLAYCFSENPEPEKLPGFPPEAVGYCALGHTEIWTKEIKCPLCIALKGAK